MYIEDLFVKFFKRIVSANYQMIAHEDYEVAYSFYNSIRDNRSFTHNQRTYVLAILARYKGLSAKIGFDYRPELDAPSWKHPLRVINKERTVWVTEEDSALTS
jgi:hypothetical protein